MIVIRVIVMRSWSRGRCGSRSWRRTMVIVIRIMMRCRCRSWCWSWSRSWRGGWCGGWSRCWSRRWCRSRSRHWMMMVIVRVIMLWLWASAARGASCNCWANCGRCHRLTALCGGCCSHGWPLIFLAAIRVFGLIVRHQVVVIVVVLVGFGSWVGVVSSWPVVGCAMSRGVVGCWSVTWSLCVHWGSVCGSMMDCLCVFCIHWVLHIQG